MALFDRIFNRTKTPITQAAGSSGVPVYAGKLMSFERSPDLQGRNLYLTLSNLIANTSTVGTGVSYYQNLIGGTSWTAEPNPDAGADGVKAADLVRTGLFEANMPDSWATCVKRAALFKMVGFSAHEWTMRRRAKDGAMVFGSIEHRPQSTVEFWDMPDGGGPLRGIVQRPIVGVGPMSEYMYVSRSRLWYCVNNSVSDSPDGVGMLRGVVEPARRLERYCQLEGFGYESNMRGMPVGRIPYRELEKYAAANGKDDAWIKAQVLAVETLVANHVKTPWQGITLDSTPYQTDAINPTISPVPMWALDLLKGDGLGLTDINVVIERLNREIARSLGMEFILLGGDGKGSLALSQDKTSMFASILEAALHELTWFAVHDLVYPLLQANGLDPEVCCPTVMPDPIATERIETTVDALAKLALAGAVMLPDDPAVNQIRRRLHLADQPKLPPEIMSGVLARAKPQPPKGGAAGPAGTTDAEGNDVAQQASDAPKGKRGGTFRQQKRAAAQDEQKLADARALTKRILAETGGVAARRVFTEADAQALAEAFAVLNGEE